MSVPFWFTENKTIIPYSKVRKHLFDTFVDIEVQDMIWGIITNNARAGKSLQDMIDEYKDDLDQTLVEYLQELQEEGYECHGGIVLGTELTALLHGALLNNDPYKPTEY